jgi:wyosine [tRNA(Phe)-imidazoG37] synthetase (radical SAM superfamily)
MTTPFQTVFFDIVGFCNGKCPYCISGSSCKHKGEWISPENFEATIKMLLSINAIDQTSAIGLYNWGEPFLYQKLDGIVEVMNKYKLKYSFSTNASNIPNISPNLVRGLDQIYFSMSGFSQASYNRIHGFKFEKICSNIKQIVTSLRKHGYRGKITILFHIYQFNLNEIKACHDFAQKIGIEFKPYFAILNNWNELVDYQNNRSTSDKLKKYSQDLFLFDFDEKIRNAPLNYKCPQWECLVLDEESNVLTCCQVPKYDNRYIVGNVLKDPIDEIMKKKRVCAVCKECVGSGLAYYLNTSLACPEFYPHITTGISTIKLVKTIMTRIKNKIAFFK